MNSSFAGKNANAGLPLEINEDKKPRKDNPDNQTASSTNLTLACSEGNKGNGEHGQDAGF